MEIYICTHGGHQRYPGRCTCSSSFKEVYRSHQRSASEPKYISLYILFENKEVRPDSTLIMYKDISKGNFMISCLYILHAHSPRTTSVSTMQQRQHQLPKYGLFLFLSLFPSYVPKKYGHMHHESSSNATLNILHILHAHVTPIRRRRRATATQQTHSTSVGR